MINFLQIILISLSTRSCESVSIITPTKIPKTSSPPTGRILPILSYSESNDFLILFGGLSSSDYENDLWTFSLSSQTWSCLYSLSQFSPYPRSSGGGFKSRFSPNFYIFGGASEDGILNDFWKFNLNTQKWAKISTKNSPSPRRLFAFCNFDDGVNEYFAIYGGMTIDEVSDELFILNITSETWEVFKPLKMFPPAFLGGNLGFFDKFLYLAGGDNNINSLTRQGRFFRFDLDSKEWFEVSSDYSYSPRVSAQSYIFENYFYIFYGLDVNSVSLISTVSRVNLNDSEFRWENISTQAGSSLYYFALAGCFENVYIFGGFVSEKESCTNQLTVFNISDNTTEIVIGTFNVPNSRQFHSMELVSGEFFVFGGKDQDTYFNDMWKFSPIYEKWTPINTLGDIPSARFACASDSEGDAYIIWGGEDKVGLRNDLYNFNALTNTWQVLNPSSIEVPNPAKGACLVVSIPIIYIYGGKTSSGFSNELWKFDLWTNKFIKISSTGIPTAYCTCSLYNSLFYVIFGSTENSSPQHQIQKYNFTSNSWLDHGNIANNTFASIQGIQIFFNESVMKMGGQLWDLHLDNRILAFVYQGSSEIMHLKNIKENLYRSAYVYYNYSVYVFGGGEAIGSNLLLGYSHNRLFKYPMDEVVNGTKYTVLCSEGTFNISDTCKVCEVGHYSENNDNKTCEPCSPGSYNSRTGSTSPRQCYPCADGFYNNETGQKNCLECPAGYVCPPGSIEPYEDYRDSSDKYIQPPIYSEPSFKAESFNFQLSLGLICGIFLLFAAFFSRTRPILRKLDFYTNIHNFILDEKMYIIANYFGGFCSGVFMILAWLVIGNSIMSYQHANILETKSLIPKVVLDNEVNEYIADKISINVFLLNYGDECNMTFIKAFLYYSQGDMKNDIFKDEYGSCVIKYTCEKCILLMGSYISINSTEKSCYTSGITVNVTSSSSIPNKISSTITELTSDPNHVFIGSDASTFYFTLIPSLFESESDEWESKLTGYHVSSQDNPSPGSQLISRELSTASLFKLNIKLMLSSSGLFTYRSIKQTPLFIISSLLGSVFGIMRALGYGMKASEKSLKAINTHLKNLKKLKKISEKRESFKKVFESKELSFDISTKSNNHLI